MVKLNYTIRPFLSGIVLFVEVLILNANKYGFSIGSIGQLAIVTRKFIIKVIQLIPFSVLQKPSVARNASSSDFFPLTPLF